MSVNVGGIEIDLTINGSTLSKSATSSMNTLESQLGKGGKKAGESLTAGLNAGLTKAEAALNSFSTKATAFSTQIQATMKQAGSKAGSDFFKGLSTSLSLTTQRLNAFRAETRAFASGVDKDMRYAARKGAINLSPALNAARGEMKAFNMAMKKEIADLRAQMAAISQPLPTPTPTPASAPRGGGVGVGRGSKLDSLQAGARSATFFASMPAAFVGKGMIDTMAEFEATMLKVQGTMGNFGESGEADMQKIIDKSRELGATTEFTASQVGEAFNFLAMTGLDTQQSLGVIGGIMDLASAEGLDFARAADISTNILNQFGLQVDDTAGMMENMRRVTNLLSATASSSNTNIEQLANAFKYLGPNAQALGISIEDTAAIIGTLGDAGIQGSLAGRALGSSLARLTKPTKEMESTMKMLGNRIQTGYTLKLTDAEGGTRRFTEFLGELQKSLEGLTTEQRQGALFKMFGAESFQEINILLQRQAEGLETYAKEITATSKAEEKAANRRKGLAFSIKEMQSAWEDLVLATADSGVRDQLVGIIKGIATELRELAKTNPEVLKMAANLAAFAVLSAPLTWMATSFIKLGKGMLSVLTLGRGLAATTNATATGINAVTTSARGAAIATGLLTASFTALAAAAVYAYTEINEANQIMDKAIADSADGMFTLDKSMARIRKNADKSFDVKFTINGENVAQASVEEELKRVAKSRGTGLESVISDMYADILKEAPTYLKYKNDLATPLEDIANALATGEKTLGIELKRAKENTDKLAALKKERATLMAAKEFYTYHKEGGMAAGASILVQDAEALFTNKPSRLDEAYATLQKAAQSGRSAEALSAMIKDMEASQLDLETRATSMISTANKLAGMATLFAETAGGAGKDLTTLESEQKALQAVITMAEQLKLPEESLAKLKEALGRVSSEMTLMVTQTAPAYARALEAVISADAGNDVGAAFMKLMNSEFENNIELMQAIKSGKIDLIGITQQERAEVMRLAGTYSQLNKAGLGNVQATAEGMQVLEMAGVKVRTNADAVLYLNQALQAGAISQQTFAKFTFQAGAEAEAAAGKIAEMKRISEAAASLARGAAIAERMMPVEDRRLKEIKEYTAHLKSQGKSANEVKTAIKELKESYDGADNNVKKFASGGGRAMKSFADTGVSEIQRFADGVIESLKTPEQKLEEFTDKIKKAVSAGALTQGQGIQAIMKERQQGAGQGGHEEGGFGSTDNLGNALSSYVTGGMKVKLDPNEMSNNINLATASAQQLEAAMYRVATPMETLGQLGKSVFQDIATAVGNINLATGDWRDSLAQVGQVILQSLVKAIAQAAAAWVAAKTTEMVLNKKGTLQAAAATQASAASAATLGAAWIPVAWAVNTATFGAAGTAGTLGMIGGMAAATSASLAFGAISSFGNAAIQSAAGGAFADGGRPPMNKVSLVGERGPELFVPDSAGTIIPNHELSGGGGGGGGGGTMPVVNVNIQNGVGGEATVNQRMGANGSLEIDVVLKRVASDISSGRGPVPRAMESVYSLRRGGSNG